MTPILLNPGPVTLSEAVRASMLQPDLCHREPEFAELQQSIRDDLLSVYLLENEQAWVPVLLTGSGTCAVEAMITSVIPKTGRLLVAENGAYGERIARMASASGIPASTIKSDWLAPIDLQAIEIELATGRYSHVAVVHHETTTGRLNDIVGLGPLCETYGVRILLDAVSSFGAENIEFDRWNLDACAATANKCLHGVPGTAFVLVRRSALDTSHQRSVYMDLATYARQQDSMSTPFTQSVQTFYAFDAALQEFFRDGGWTVRHRTLTHRIGRVRKTLVSLGVRPILRLDETSCVLHSFELPSGIDYRVFHDGMKSEGFIVYASTGLGTDRGFRVSTMGAIEETDLDRLDDAFYRHLR